jgi:hypothetical protein
VDFAEKSGYFLAHQPRQRSHRHCSASLRSHQPRCRRVHAAQPACTSRSSLAGATGRAPRRSLAYCHDAAERYTAGIIDTPSYVPRSSTISSYMYRSLYTKYGCIFKSKRCQDDKRQSVCILRTKWVCLYVSYCQGDKRRSVPVCCTYVIRGATTRRECRTATHQDEIGKG